MKSVLVHTCLKIRGQTCLFEHNLHLSTHISCQISCYIDSIHYSLEHCDDQKFVPANPKFLVFLV